MVKLKYSALYTDNLGCEQAIVYFSKGEFQLKVRGCTFKSDSLNFDFSAMNYNKAKQLFYFKDDDLIEYVIDIKIPLILAYNNEECREESILRIERSGNYYNNSISLLLKGVNYYVEGYDLKELLSNINKKLPEEYHINYSFLSMLGNQYFEENRENYYCNLIDFDGKLKLKLKKDLYYMLFNSGHKKKSKKLQKVPITYICNKCC